MKLHNSKRRLVNIALIQGGPVTEDKEKTIESSLKLVDQVADQSADFICFNELFSTPYFCAVRDPKYFDWAEPIPGPTTEAFAEKAKKYGCCILVPMFERYGINEYYDSVAVIGPDGELIRGVLPDGTEVQRYAKVQVHLAEIPAPSGGVIGLYEDFYFKPGRGVAVFNTPKAKIGICLCVERYFPEIWRIIGLQGGEIAFMPSGSPLYAMAKGATTEAMFTSLMQVRALENQFWVAGVNKGGREKWAGKQTLFYGRSCVVHPSGEIVAQGPSSKPAVLSAIIDLQAVAMAREMLPLWEYRRPELYRLLGRYEKTGGNVAPIVGDLTTIF